MEVESFMQQNRFIKIKDTVNEIAGDQLYINKLYLSNIQQYLYQLKSFFQTSINFLKKNC